PFSEGILTAPGQVAGVHRCARSPNVLRVNLAADCQVDLARLERHSYTTSSCGVCGKTALASIRVPVERRGVPDQPVLDGDIIRQLPSRLRDAQAVFARTGGLHAAGLFEQGGTLLTVREDIGRHNALDKLLGHEFLAGRLPLDSGVVLVSGRLCFELVQKAAVAGVPVLAAVGAPSSLAVELARECGMTLIGFVRDDRFNVYTGAGRVAVS
ncbi:MAG: formate dehydrogenase accessory sulfurtransferase FdhD, partial [Gemmataceae bacterium]|nr:formate dehydrogenase accessory sulfurtransferase FdhD [Gemmataceae bacterium]